MIYFLALILIREHVQTSIEIRRSEVCFASVNNLKRVEIKIPQEAIVIKVREINNNRLSRLLIWWDCETVYTETSENLKKDILQTLKFSQMFLGATAIFSVVWEGLRIIYKLCWSLFQFSFFETIINFISSIIELSANVFYVTQFPFAPKAFSMTASL